MEHETKFKYRASKNDVYLWARQGPISELCTGADTPYATAISRSQF